MKRITAITLVLILMFILVACDTNTDRFQSAMRQITAGVENITPEPEPPVVTLPEDEHDTDKPDPVPEARWPIEVPEVKEYEEKSLFVKVNDEFRARYVMTAVQLQKWTADLTIAGFVGEPRTNEGLIVEYETVKKDDNLNVTIIIRPIDTTWPEEFKMFPEFPTTGKIVAFSTYDQNSTRVLHITIKNETKSAVDVYISMLKKAGFSDFGEANYTKIVNEVHYVFECDPDVLWTGSTANLYFRIY